MLLLFGSFVYLGALTICKDGGVCVGGGTYAVWTFEREEWVSARPLLFASPGDGGEFGFILGV